MLVRMFIDCLPEAKDLLCAKITGVIDAAASTI